MGSENNYFKLMIRTRYEVRQDLRGGCSEDWSSVFRPVRVRRQVKSFQTNRVEILGFSRNRPYFQRIVVWIPSLPLAFQFSPCLPQLDCVCCFWTEMLNKILVPQVGDVLPWRKKSLSEVREWNLLVNNWQTYRKGIELPSVGNILMAGV